MGDNIWPALIAAAIGGLGGALVGSIVPYLLNRKNERLQRTKGYAELDQSISVRLGKAISELQSKHLNKRMFALGELKKLGRAVPEEQEDIVRILGLFIREAIENLDRGKCPDAGVYLAAEVASLFFTESSYKVDLRGLKALDIVLSRMTLQGAQLEEADFQGTELNQVDFQYASLSNSKFQGAELKNTVFCGAKFMSSDFQDVDLSLAHGIDIKQLHRTTMNEATRLSEEQRGALDAFRAELDALRATHGVAP
ncbi:MAG: pentapeptide repeat-containing protein [Oscillospiraceae bacterium]|nr:pentapeptide repeat-containing protein [Oscillospiraceae bacterium]